MVDPPFDILLVHYEVITIPNICYFFLSNNITDCSQRHKFLAKVSFYNEYAYTPRLSK